MHTFAEFELRLLFESPMDSSQGDPRQMAPNEQASAALCYLFFLARDLSTRKLFGPNSEGYPCESTAQGIGKW